MTNEHPTIADEAIAMFLELSPDAVVVADADGTVVGCNAALLELTGYPCEDIKGQPIELLIPEKLRTRHVVARGTFAKTASTRPMGAGRDLWLLRADGVEVAIDIVLRPIQTLDGQQFAAVIRDVSAARAICEQLGEAESKLRGMIEAQQDGMAVMRAIWGHDGDLLDMEVEFANPAVAKILHLQADSMVGLRVKNVIADDDLGFLDFVELFRTGTPLTHEKDWHDPLTGELLAVLDVRGVLADPDHAVITVRDIHDIRRASDHAEAMNDELVVANQSMEDAADFQRDFISASSHELRTPLTAVIGFAEILVERWGDMSAVARQDAAMSILRNAQRQEQLVDDLGHAAHLQSGRLELRVGPLDLDELIAETLDSVAGAESIATPSPTGLRVRADAGRTIQVLINLLSNALRHGQPPYEVRIGSTDTTVAVVMLDTGPGVPADFVPHLFTAFAQASRGLRRQPKGAGLGLYISKSLAQAMGGDVVHRDTDDGRTEFTLTVPRAQ